jgi:hypothetical protein
MISNASPPRPPSLGLRILALLVVVALVAVGAIGIVLARTSEPPPPPLAEPVEPMYPDLGMAPLKNILVGTEVNTGEVFLRFSASIVNIGEADLLVAAHRPMPFGGDWTVRQRIVDATGGFSERTTEAQLVYAGDAHDHWHVAEAEAHQVETMDGEVVASLTKIGFCFFDNLDYATELPMAPQAVVHHASECGEQFNREIGMGLSVGWGDEYPWYLFGQSIEITDVPDGRYRLRAVADPTDWFKETDETNNETWTIIDLKTVDGVVGVEIVEEGPAAPTPGSP